MINSTDLKNGVAFLHHGKPYQVVNYSLIKMGRGGATVKLIARNLEMGSTEEISFSSNVSVEEADTLKRILQYLYNDGTNAVFMDGKTFEQVEVPLSVLGDQIKYLNDGDSVVVLFWGEKALSIDLPPKVTVEIAETDPGVKGNSVSNLYKPAKTANGLLVKVPLFINKGEKVVVDTRNGSYVERAKS